MEILLDPGTYVVAVSGGVDSMALLHILYSNSEFQNLRFRFIVAHFEHGVREDSMEDLRLVRDTARQYGMPFVYDRGRLGAGVSEDKARRARYEFLRRVERASAAKAIITAHHQDDLLETAVLNLMRGTNRRGLSSLSSGDIVRPLLLTTKDELLDYARAHNLQWHEDSTNADTTYKRNYIRHKILKHMNKSSKQELLGHLRHLAKVNIEIDRELINYLHVQPKTGVLDRGMFIILPHNVAREVMAAWLRANGLNSYDSKTLERLVVAAKTLEANKKVDVICGASLDIGSTKLTLIS